MKRQLKEYFYYTKQERNGTLALAALCLLLLIFPYLYRHFIKQPALDKTLQKQLEQWMADTLVEHQSAIQPVFSFDPNTISKDSLILLGLSPKVAQTIINYRNKVGAFNAKTDLKKIYTLKEEDYNRLEAYVSIKTTEDGRFNNKQFKPAQKEKFFFDPNAVSEEELQRLGFSDATIRNMLKYRTKGGRFYTAQDIYKIYGLDKKLASELEPYIKIETQNAEVDTVNTRLEKEEFSSPGKSKTVSWEPTNIDINQSDAEDWQKLRGIGPSYAKRIIRFREALGGFTSIGQVAETYKLPDSTFQQIQAFLKTSPIYRKLEINKADAEALKVHPYINWKQARAIVNYRLQHGNFEGAEDLQKIKILPPEMVEQLGPYLAF